MKYIVEVCKTAKVGKVIVMAKDRDEAGIVGVSMKNRIRFKAEEKYLAIILREIVEKKKIRKKREGGNDGNTTGLDKTKSETISGIAEGVGTDKGGNSVHIE